MNRKLTLEIETLNVDTFAVAGKPASEGTVVAREAITHTCLDSICIPCD